MGQHILVYCKVKNILHIYCENMIKYLWTNRHVLPIGMYYHVVTYLTSYHKTIHSLSFILFIYLFIYLYLLKVSDIALVGSYSLYNQEWFWVQDPSSSTSSPLWKRNAPTWLYLLHFLFFKIRYIIVSLYSWAKKIMVPVQLCYDLWA